MKFTVIVINQEHEIVNPDNKLVIEITKEMELKSVKAVAQSIYDYSIKFEKVKGRTLTVIAESQKTTDVYIHKIIVGNPNASMMVMYYNEYLQLIWSGLNRDERLLKKILKE